MSIFGRDKEQDERLDEVERHLRRMIEQISQLSIDLSVTRVELRKVQVTTDALSKSLAGKIDLSSIDPVLDAFNSKLKATRAALQEAKEAADADWEMLQSDADQLLGDLNTAASRYTDAE
jgi:chromosome segregation ATPase